MGSQQPPLPLRREPENPHQPRPIRTRGGLATRHCLKYEHRPTHNDGNYVSTPYAIVVDFVNRNKDDIVEGRKLGARLICKILQVAPSTDYAARDRAPSARTLSDAVLSGEPNSLWEKNRKLYGVRKLWKAARRAGLSIGRDQTARLMRSLGIEGVQRSKRVKTTTPDPTAVRHPDLVKRVFSSNAPNQLWVTDLTFVPTWAGVAYVCFIIDAYSRMIVGWRAASHMKTETVLDAIEMARWSRGKKLPGLRCHSDAGSQFTFIRYGGAPRRDRRCSIDWNRW